MNTDSLESDRASNAYGRHGLRHYAGTAGAPTAYSLAFDSDWSQWAEDEIRNAFNESDGWDGRGGAPASAFAASQATLIVPVLVRSGLSKPVSLGPTPDGGITIEWAREQGSLVVEIDAEGGNTVGWYRTADGSYKEFELELMF